MDTYLEPVNQLLPIHHRVAGFNPALNQLYPVAIAEGDQLLIYDDVAKRGHYTFIKSMSAPIPIPTGVRAAFQLEDYDGRIVCVVTPDVFDTPEGYVTLLHEFVHCYQYETCEQDLKQSLDVARQAQEKGDYMWEIQHPFPYQAEAFTRAYTHFFEAVSRGVQADIHQVRQDLWAYLGRHDYEYLVWQEWKEGFARWVENRLQAELDLNVNHKGRTAPFSRVSFYAGGAAYIECLQAQDPSLVDDLQRLFIRLAAPLAVN